MPPLERGDMVTLRFGDVLADPAASDWLKAALAAAVARDPVDAAHDASVLHDLLDARCAQLLALDQDNADQPALPFSSAV